ncbi:hypothetical protein TEU_03265 [Thermococcus eurythermalis]|uniref:Uncharacterized protein n=1 Tax=Thermococcus eurythermalis TaxID=1505907 RepID=A0A097QSL3_9EURY|nr:hypothetical protein [Thermococcus eurythermalis]AIU69444.1 hypothetical protein TEU_03265 [Thermococcus eurythermalis]
MVSKKELVVALALSLILVSLALSRYSLERDSFTGLCVRSSPSFSLLYDGREAVAVGRQLNVGEIYTVEGRLRKTENGLWMDVASAIRSNATFPLERIEGAYWYSNGPLLLTPRRVYLPYPLNVSKGAFVRVQGLTYGSKFYPVKVEEIGSFHELRNGMPYSVDGVVLYGGNPATLWNGSEEFRVYLPYGLTLKPGSRVRVLGIARLHSTVILYAGDGGDVEFLGPAESKPLENAKIGETATGECLVIKSTSRYLNLNCTSLRLYGFRARPGDTLRFKALRRKSSLLCLECSVVRPREKLPNGICSFREGSFARISGTAVRVKTYRNGFGIANVTNGTCSVLLKLPSRLGVSLVEGDNVTAYGFFTLYKGKPAFEVQSGDDLCCGKRC